MGRLIIVGINTRRRKSLHIFEQRFPSIVVFDGFNTDNSHAGYAITGGTVCKVTGLVSPSSIASQASIASDIYCADVAMLLRMKRRII
jgi:hypothetical protein